MLKRLTTILVLASLVVTLLAGCGQEPPEGEIAETPSSSTDSPTDESEPDTSPPPEPDTPSTLTMLSITEGGVFILKAGAGDWVEAEVGMTLEVGDSVKSGDNSNVEITFFDGSTIELLAGTQIEVAALDIAADTGSTTIMLKQGVGETISRVEKLFDAASRYEVETPAGVAAVRGSSMHILVIENGTSWVTNLGGEIWVIVNKVGLRIPEGRQCVIIPGREARLIPLDGGGGGGVGFTPNPVIALTKVAEAPWAYVGDTITYTYTVTNPGNVPLSDVSVTDDMLSTVTYQSGDTNGDSILDTTETWVFSADYVIGAEDASPLVNNAIASGTDASSQTVTLAVASASVTILRPAIAITKVAEPTQVHDSDIVTYTYSVTNTGSLPLFDVSVDDDQVGAPDYQYGDTNGDSILDIDETWVYTATYVISCSDDSPLVNTAIASGTDASSQTVTAEATASVDILRPVIAITKVAEPTQAYVGDTITYTYTVTNAGNTPLSNVLIIDYKTGTPEYQYGDTNGDSILDIDETWVYTATYVITAGDISPLVNTAEAYGTDLLYRPVSAMATASVIILSE